MVREVDTCCDAQFLQYPSSSKRDTFEHEQAEEENSALQKQQRNVTQSIVLRSGLLEWVYTSIFVMVPLRLYTSLYPTPLPEGSQDGFHFVILVHLEQGMTFFDNNADGIE